MVRRPDEDDDRPRDTEEEEDPVEMLDHLMQADGTSLPPIAPDGGFAPAGIAGEPSPIPEANVDTMICLAGPCKNYVEQLVWFPSGNVEGSPGYDLKEIVRYCDRLRSAHISLTDEVVFSCNAWDPLSEQEQDARRALSERLTQIRKDAKS